TTTTNDPNSENDTTVGVTQIPVPASDVSVTKAGPTGATAGADVTYSISLVSVGPDPATSVTLTDPLPGTETFVSLVQNNGPAFNCPPLTVGSGGTVTCTLASFPAGTGASFTLVAHIPNGTGSGTVYDNTATVSAAEDTNPENDVSPTRLIVSAADLAITKTGPPTVTAGTSIIWTITASNGGPDTADNVRIHDALPAGTVFVSLSQSSGPPASCATPAPGTNGSVDCGLPDLGSGTSVVLVLTAGVSSSVVDGTALANTASMDSDTGDPSTANNTSTSISAVSAQADLSVTKTGPAALSAGQNATFTITITNNGPSDAQTVALTDAVPGNATFVSETQTVGPAFVCTNPPVGGTGTINCTAGSLLAGAAATFTVVVNVNASASGTISNTASVTATTTDPNAGNDTATATATLTGSADLAVTKTGPAGVTAGQTATFTIVATNNGPSDAQTVSLSDPVPANSTFASMLQNSGPAFTCTTPAAGGTGTATCTIATLVSGGSATFTLVLNTPIGLSGTISNTATITSATGDPNAANNTATAAVTVAPAIADLSIAKSASAGNIIPGTNVTYTIVVTNNGPSAATGVTVTDVLPVAMTFVSATTTQGSCTGTTTVTCNVGSILNGANATITITATAGTTLTSTTNTATVTSTSSDPNPANDSSTTNVAIVESIPTLSPRSLLFLVLLLGAAGVFVMRSS
ncbi:MAG: IPTL-CTERM sorting domain-containing protein, partial [Thermoanaerobaculia bacterium]